MAKKWIFALLFVALLLVVVAESLRSPTGSHPSAPTGVSCPQATDNELQETMKVHHLPPDWAVKFICAPDENKLGVLKAYSMTFDPSGTLWDLSYRVPLTQYDKPPYSIKPKIVLDMIHRVQMCTTSRECLGKLRGTSEGENIEFERQQLLADLAQFVPCAYASELREAVPCNELSPPQFTDSNPMQAEMALVPLEQRTRKFENAWAKYRACSLFGSE